MPAGILQRYDQVIARLSGKIPESLMLLFVRVVLGGIFWRSGQTKVVEGSFFTLNDTTVELFRTEYSGVPLPPEWGAPMATAAEHILPAMLMAGLFTRLSASGLIGMTMVIQIFVYPESWWTEHALWVAMALVLLVRGGGLFSLDALLLRKGRG